MAAIYDKYTVTQYSINSIFGDIESGSKAMGVVSRATSVVDAGCIHICRSGARVPRSVGFF